MDDVELIALRIVALRTLAMVALMQPQHEKFIKEQLDHAITDASRITIKGKNEGENVEQFRASVREEIRKMFGEITLERQS
jgi:hypothetical protein